MCKKPKGIHNRIDKCMNNIIENLNTMLRDEIKTVACCCGHGKYPMTIIVKNTNWKAGECNFEIFSGKYINRKRNFYKKDKQGYYYIPEIAEKARRVKK